ncbi:hypothetical protein KP509_14G095400 [Ceratopteris richardii]|uniref:Uncharacterized protein n=1 Tax=Ceratopteris richardii TaxID=49495 RepID=A0A8T2TCF5_CERRI|nr:hypothetical protein KP509_14G095400 [Ceratopteris richardii]KAH7416522.1 hypothetical protein KP509_14G095400 [Ceratopteris richardii]
MYNLQLHLATCIENCFKTHKQSSVIKGRCQIHFPARFRRLSFLQDMKRSSWGASFSRHHVRPEPVCAHGVGQSISALAYPMSIPLKKLVSTAKTVIASFFAR